MDKFRGTVIVLTGLGILGDFLFLHVPVSSKTALHFVKVIRTKNVLLISSTTSMWGHLS